METTSTSHLCVHNRTAFEDNGCFECWVVVIFRCKIYHMVWSYDSVIIIIISNTGHVKLHSHKQNI